MKTMSVKVFTRIACLIMAVAIGRQSGWLRC